MRDTADPDVHQDAPPAAPHPATPEPAPAPAEPAEQPAAPATASTTQDPDAPQPARVTAGPVIAMTAETITAAGAALWHVGGWTAVGLGAAGLAGAATAAVARRGRGGGWRQTRTRTWSTSSSGRRVPASFGRASGGSARRGRMPSLGGSGGAGAARRGAGSRVGSRTGGMPGAGRRAGRAGFPGAGKRGAGASGSGRRAASATGPALRRAGYGARRAARAGSGALDRAAAGAIRGRAAARAARAAMRNGGTPRAASRAARAALKDAHRNTQVRGAWRRTLGSAAWGLGGWGIGWAAHLISKARDRFRLRPGDQQDDEEGAEQPRIETTVDRPANPAAGGHSGGADTMGSRGGTPHFVGAAEVLAESYSKYEPPPGPGGMVQMYADISHLPGALDQVAAGLNVLAKRCREELPLHPAVSEFLHEMAKAQVTMASIAAEIKPAIERLHEKELERHRAPRPSEERWNV
jgi:hypothetical protein